MTLRLVWDIETNGLLDQLDRLHCITAVNPDTGQEYAFGPDEIDKGLALLATVDEHIGHNLIGFDFRAIAKVYPDWKPKPGSKVYDTLLLTMLHRPDLSDSDAKLVRFKGMPPKLRNSHSLKAWGWRLGVMKDDFGDDPEDDWSVFTPRMWKYAQQDPRVNTAIWNFLERQKLSPRAVEIEMELAPILVAQEEVGFGFNRQGAITLLAELKDREAVLADELKEFVPAWWKAGPEHINKGTRSTKLPHFPDIEVPRFSKLGKPLKPYVGPPKETRFDGTRYVNIKWTEFAPHHRAQLAERLQTLYGWKPQVWNKDGTAKLDDDIIQTIPDSVLPPRMKHILLEFYVLGKIIGYLEKGAGSWLKSYNEETGCIHGRVIQNGAVTGRATHRNPNIAQVPKVQHTKAGGILMGYEGGWGFECRSLFRPHREDLILVGCDMSGLELRCLAHYCALMGDTSYVETVTQGDPHTYHMELAGLPSRDIAKTWIYAFLYGAGVWLLGHIADPTASDEAKRSLGAKLKKTFLKNFTALGKLSEKVRETAKERKYLIGIDGRRLHIRSVHSALNTLLQSAGSIACKQWIIEFHRSLPQNGLIAGQDVFQHAWVHDEMQLSTRPELGETIGQLARAAATRSGETLGFRCPLTGEYKIGRNWAETH